MAHKQIAELKVMSGVKLFNTKFLRTILLGALLVIFASIGKDVFAQNGASAPPTKNSDNTADRNLKSVARVNPSTLAMEFDVPFMTYPGRNRNSMPVGFSYSSKVWRMDDLHTWSYRLPYSCTKQYVTHLIAKYAERSMSGWTSGFTPPIIEEKVERYDVNGKPFSLSALGVLEFYEELSGNYEGFFEQAINNPNPPCGWYCADVCTPTGGCNGGNLCENWEYNYCGQPETGGCNGYPQIPPVSDPIFTVKRVQVRTSDGATHEFRASDGRIQCGTNQSYNCTISYDGIYLSVDGSGMRLERDSGGSTLFMPDGSRYRFPATTQRFADGTKLFYASDFTDSDGNKVRFDQFVEDNKVYVKKTDTLGREIADPLPQNFGILTPKVETQDVSLPGLNGNQEFDLVWKRLKPRGCEDKTNEDCGGGDGALENQSERLYFDTDRECFGATYTTIPDDNPNANEYLFMLDGWGIRTCTSFRFVGENPNTTITHDRFNPVVLAAIVLPNEKQYEFKYNQWGEITKITYPTGSSEKFEYGKIAPLSGFSEPAYEQVNRGVKKRWVYQAGSGTPEQYWEYGVNLDTANHTYTITTTAPKQDYPTQPGMKTERVLKYVDDWGVKWGFDDPLAGMVIEERTKDENGILRARTLNEWITTDVDMVVYTAKRDPRIRRTISVIIEGDQALAQMFENVYQTYADSGVQSDPSYFALLNVRQSKTYHYKAFAKEAVDDEGFSTIANHFTNTTPAAISETVYIYDPNYKANGMSSLPKETRTLDPATNQVIAKSQIIYDNQLPDAASSYPVSYSLLGYDGVGTSLDCAAYGEPQRICWEEPNPSSPDTFYRGKPTTTRVWKEGDTWIETHAQYDIFGNVRKAWDADGDTTRFIETEYDSANKYGYATKVITPAPDPTNTTGTNLTSQVLTSYDFVTGLALTVTDDFGQIMKTEYQDDLLRPTRTFGFSFTMAETQTIYDDTPITLIINGVDVGDGDPVSVKVRKQIDTSNWNEAETFFDNLGRTVKTQTKDSQGDVFVETNYNSLGKVKEVTNPYRQGDTVYWSKTSYDELGRAVESFAPAPSGSTGTSLGTTAFSSSTVTNYIGTVVTSTDAALRKSRSITNALGQILRIDESIAIGGSADADLGTLLTPIQPTYYTYSPLGKMVKVQQGKAGDTTIQYRYFLYDNLGRLIRVRQPEQETNSGLNMYDPITQNSNWTAGFNYDNLNNLVTTTDAKGTVVTTTYDKTSRITAKTYSNEPSGVTTPAVSFRYDGKGLDAPQTFAKGKLTFVNNTISQTRYTTFDNLGSTTSSEQRTPLDGQTIAQATPRVSLYEYNSSGALIKETYPSGRVVQNEFESDGDLRRIYGKANSNATEKTYANSFSYTPDGRIEKLRLGNGLWESTKFNTRLQVTELALGIGVNDASRWKLNYEYGELNVDGTVNEVKNTGNIAKQTLSFNGLANPFVQTFKYDSLYRLKEAKETVGTNPTPTWKQNFDYDRFGNRITFTHEIGGQVQTNTNLTHPSIDPTMNRFNLNQGYVYDKNGNLTSSVDPNNIYQTRSFTFNGENQQTKVVLSGQNVGEYFYDGEGKRVKKKVYTNGQVSEETVFVYSAGKLAAEYSTAPPPPTPTTSYTMTDQLDSPRAITNSLGEVTSRRDFKPFGEEIASELNYRTANRKYGVGDNIRQKFTGYQKDVETQLDFAEARMYQNLHGRFTAIDPLLASGKSANPQTFNRYVYCLNNPLQYTDKNGKWPTWVHDYIIGKAFPNLNKYQLDRIRYGSALVDTYFGTGDWADIPTTLLVSNAYLHAMTPDGMDPNDARRLANQFIENTLNGAVNNQRDNFGPTGGTYPQLSAVALSLFGQAMHPIMDNTSPAHRIFQLYKIPTKTITLYWGGILIPVTVYDLAKWKNELLEHKALEDRVPTEAELKENVLQLRVHFLATFGNRAFKKAVKNSAERQEIYDYMRENNLNYTEGPPSNFQLQRRFHPGRAAPAPARR